MPEAQEYRCPLQRSPALTLQATDDQRVLPANLRGCVAELGGHLHYTSPTQAHAPLCISP